MWNSRELTSEIKPRRWSKTKRKKKYLCADDWCYERGQRNSAQFTRGQVPTKFCGWVWYPESEEPTPSAWYRSILRRQLAGAAGKKLSDSVSLFFFRTAWRSRKDWRVRTRFLGASNAGGAVGGRSEGSFGRDRCGTLVEESQRTCRSRLL